MKKYFLLMLLFGQLAWVPKTYSQNIAINATGSLPDTSAMLDVSSASKGFLAPRMTTAQRDAIPLPATGLLIFNSTANLFNVNTGTAASPIWTNLATAGNNWSLTGNNGITQPAAPVTYGTSTFGVTENFVGTKDAKDLVLGTNNVERARILNTNGDLGIGTSTPTSTLQINGSLSTAVIRVTGNTTLNATNSLVLVTTGSSNKTITLPPAATCTGRVYTIKKIDGGSGDVIIDGNGSEKIDGSSVYTSSAAQYESITLQSDGTQWWNISIY